MDFLSITAQPQSQLIREQELHAVIQGWEHLPFLSPDSVLQCTLVPVLRPSSPCPGQSQKGGNVHEEGTTDFMAFLDPNQVSHAVYWRDLNHMENHSGKESWEMCVVLSPEKIEEQKYVSGFCLCWCNCLFTHRESTARRRQSLPKSHTNDLKASPSPCLSNPKFLFPSLLWGSSCVLTWLPVSTGES